jgi:DNA modification methylase
MELSDLPSPERVEEVPPKNLHVDGDNPNEQSDEMFGLLCENLQAKGWIGNAIVSNTGDLPGYDGDPEGLIADGEHRWRAAEEIGLEAVPVKFYDFEDDAERRLWRQELNKISGEHDSKRDALEYDFLLQEGRAEDVQDLVNATDEDLDELLDEVRESKSTDVVYEYSSDHNVYFEDCVEGMQSRLDTESVHCTVTSPPYAVNKEYESDNSIDDHWQLMESVFSEIARVTVPGGFIAINAADIVAGRTMHDADEISEIPVMHRYHEILREHEFSLFTRVVWDKLNQPTAQHTIQGKYNHLALRTVPEWEYLWIWKKEGSRSPPGPHDESLLSEAEWRDYRRGIWRIESVDANDDHPAKFPTELPGRVIDAYSYPGDIILDPFMGSGTTAVAAIQRGRDYVGFELDETGRYQPVVERRISETERQVDAPEAE